jgi:hypothetical protein
MCYQRHGNHRCWRKARIEFELLEHLAEALQFVGASAAEIQAFRQKRQCSLVCGADFLTQLSDPAQYLDGILKPTLMGHNGGHAPSGFGVCFRPRLRSRHTRLGGRRRLPIAAQGQERQHKFGVIGERVRRRRVP